MANDSHGNNLGRGLAAGAIFFAMTIAAFSLWTAIPLSWIYIGSKASHTQFPSEMPYLIVGVGIIVSITITGWLIARLNDLYIRVTGTNRLTPMRPAWLKSMRDTGAARGTTTVVEAVMMISVLMAALSLTVWFFLLAGSPIPNQ